MNARPDIRLSRGEAWAALAEAHTGILASVRADGTPVALPMWFVALDERLYVVTPEMTKKVARIRQNPRVSFLIESGTLWTELLGVQLNGDARVVTDPSLLTRVREAMDRKYESFRTPPADMPEGVRRHTDIPMAVIEITPDDRILTWDNSRLQMDG